MIATLLVSQTIENTFYLPGVVVDFREGFDPTDLISVGLASSSIADGADIIQHVDNRPV